MLWSSASTYERRYCLLVAIDDAATGEVIGRDLDLDPVARQNTNAVLSHLAAEMSQHCMPVIELDPKVAALEGFLGDAFQHNGVIFKLGQLASPFVLIW